jgi:hypothetical protein
MEVVAKRSLWFRPKDGHYPPPDVVVLARWKISFLDLISFLDRISFRQHVMNQRVHFLWYNDDGEWVDADAADFTMDEPTEWRHLPQTLRAWHLPRHPP